MSLNSSTLLSPPHTPTTPTDSPFKPKEGDTVSLNMKRRRKGHSDNIIDLHKASSADNNLRDSHRGTSRGRRLHRTRSLPNLRGLNTPPGSKADPPGSILRNGFTDHRRRRWTLPSKAAPTSRLADGVSAFRIKIGPDSIVGQRDDSPAMITLRRATGSHSSRKMSITFFPEPKFQRTKSGFLSLFLETITGAGSEPGPDLDGSRGEQSRRSSHSASIDSGVAQPSNSERAPTVCTELAGMEKRLSIPGQKNEDYLLRRCSTRYVSGGSVYEVIWDENGSSTTNESPPLLPEPSPAARRASVAMEQLQTQLFKAEAQSRRASMAAQSQFRMRSSGAGMHNEARQPSLSEVLTFKFSLPGNDNFLSHLSRTKRSKTAPCASPDLSRVFTEVCEEPRADESDFTVHGIEFFPPLRSRSTTVLSKTASSHTTHSPAGDPVSARSETTPPRIASRPVYHSGVIGTMVGVSTHLRRSSTPDNWKVKRRSNNAGDRGGESRRNSAFIQPRKREGVEDDTIPLLSSFSMLE